jgi:hypothetical protein
MSLLFFGAAMSIALAQNEPGQLTARQMYFKKADAPAEVKAPATPSATKSAANLGLRYAIVEKGSSGRMDREVNPDKDFHSGEIFALKLESNEDAYLYVFSVSNGELLYPGGPDKTNVIKANTSLTIPRNCAAGQMDDCFKFDQEPTTEKLLIILSQQPEPDIQRILPSAGGARPGTTQMASAKLAPSRLDLYRSQMRSQLESRGIVRDTVSSPEGSVNGENAVYVVQASQSTKPRVITEIVLKHK